MKASQRWICFVFAFFCAALPFRAQEHGDSAPAFQMVAGGGVPRDWSHHHLVFSAAADDTTRSKAQLDARYWLQLLRRNGSQDPGSAEEGDAERIMEAQLERLREREEREFIEERTDRRDKGRGDEKEPLRRDWSQTFQTNGTLYTFATPTYPAKFSFSSVSPSPNCTADYVAFTLPTGSATFPGNFNIIGYNNLYVTTAGGASFCTGTAPQAIFEYNASTAGGPLTGSPTLSLDGTLIAFVENAAAANGGAVLHILKWHSGDAQQKDTLFPQAFNSAALASCTTNGGAAPCMYNVQYTPSGSPKTASITSPFVDYNNDVAYVSDDGGNVYAISPVFTATPTNPPAVLTGWPVNVGASVVLTAPVYDGNSKNVFVASTTGTEYFVKASGSTTGSCTTGSAPCLGSNTFAFNGGGTIADSPVVDSNTEKVFLFGTQTGATSGSYVVQTDAALTPGSVEEAQVGTGSLNPIYPGTPDNKYFTSVSTGTLYVCGQNTVGEGELFGFGFNASGVLNTSAGTPLGLGQAATTDSPCSAGLTENYNETGAKDWLYIGVANRCVNTMFGGNGCVLSLDITTGFPSGVTHQIQTQGTTGTSGIIVDNILDASKTQITTDIYYIVLAGASCLDYLGSNHTGNCAVSATQAGLQ